MLPFPQQPMLARPAATLPDEGDLAGGTAYEPKFDGFRALVFVEPGRCCIQSRSGQDVTAAFPEIAEAVISHVPSGVVLDGELVIWGDELADHSELQRRLENGADPTRSTPASYIAFDLLAGAGMDMRSSPLRLRRQALTMLLDDAPAPLHVVPQTRDVAEAQTWMVDYEQTHVGIEGVVAKGLGTPYSPGERGWEKVRFHDTVECVVGAVMGRPEAPDCLVLGLVDDAGQLQLVGHTHALTLPQRRRLGSRFRAADSEHPWSGHDAAGTFDALASMALVEPTTVIEITAPDRAADVPWSDPVEFVRVRPDLLAAEVESISLRR